MNFNETIENLQVNRDKLRDLIINVDKHKARQLLVLPTHGSAMINALLNLQDIHGMVIAMHPETVYDSDAYKFRDNTIFNDVVVLSKSNTKVIDVALGIFQYFRSTTSKFISSEEHCFELITNPIDKCTSFYSLVIQVLSNCNQIISYLKNLSIAEQEKGSLQNKRVMGIKTTRSGLIENAPPTLPQAMASRINTQTPSPPKIIKEKEKVEDKEEIPVNTENNDETTEETTQTTMIQEEPVEEQIENQENSDNEDETIEENSDNQESNSETGDFPA